MKAYKFRNELSDKDQHKHVYIQLPNGLLIELTKDMIIERNGIIIIETVLNGEIK